MNNFWFWVKIGMIKFEDNGFYLMFEYFIWFGNLIGGWMMKILVQEFVQVNLNVKVVVVLVVVCYIKLFEVCKYQKEDFCWIIVCNKVYDCMLFLEDYLGGVDSIFINGGMDFIEEFDVIYFVKV